MSNFSGYQVYIYTIEIMGCIKIFQNIEKVKNSSSGKVPYIP